MKTKQQAMEALEALKTRLVELNGSLSESMSIITEAISGAIVSGRAICPNHLRTSKDRSIDVIYFMFELDKMGIEYQYNNDGACDWIKLMVA